MSDRYSGGATWRRSRLVLTPPQPAAGADWTVTVPAGHIYHVLAVMALLTTSAAVGNRTARLFYNDGVVDFVGVPPFATPPASTAMRYSWFPAALGLSTGILQTISVPEVTLLPGGSVRTSTGGLDVADQWSGIALQLVDTTYRGGPVDLSQAAAMLVEVVQTPGG